MRSGKVWVSLILVCLLMSVALISSGEGAGTLSWRGYVLTPTWQTADRAAIKTMNLRQDGLFLLVRLQPVDQKIDTALVRENASGDYQLRLSDGELSPLAALMFHTLNAPEGGGFIPDIAPEQDYFDVLFFLKDKDETALDGAELIVADNGDEQTVGIASVSPERPEEIPAPSVGFATFETVVVEVSDTTIYLSQY